MSGRRWTAIALALAVATTWAAASPAEEDDALRFDPFALPDFERLARERPDSHAHEESDEWSPVLRATLVGKASTGSFANLGGVVLRVGEAFEGYQLLAVREREADFVHGEELLTLVIDREDAP